MEGKAMVISAQECCGMIAAVEFVQNGEFISSVATCENCGYVEMWQEALSVADWELIRNDVMSWVNMFTAENVGADYWRNPDPVTTRESIVIREILPGRGRHACTDECKDPCYRMCDDSDVIVTVDYGTRGYGADYAMLDGRPVLWAN
jgi:predicted nucleic-acid-binding Zn-ribbon protein